MSEYLSHGNGEEKKRFRAAVKTVAINRGAQIDVAVGTAIASTPFLINTKSEAAAALLSPYLGTLGTWLRAMHVQGANKRAYEDGLEGDYFPNQRDERTVWGYVADAVKTGEPQLPQVTERKFDGIDRARHFNRPR
jgi:hypothetical protein